MKRKRKRKLSPWEWLCFFGVPQTLTAVGIGIYAKNEWCKRIDNKSFDLSDVDYKVILMIIGFFWIVVVLRNTVWLQSKRKIGFFSFIEKYEYEPPETDESIRKRKAQYPEVDEEYLSDTPNQLVLGRVGSKFFRLDLKRCLPILMISSPGGGKTTLLLTMIISSLHKKTKSSSLKPAMFVFDYKEGELYHKSSMPDNKNVLFVSLTGRDACGWDMYYCLNKESTDDEVIRELTLISTVLIDGENKKNLFFTSTARTIFVFVGLYCFRNGMSFIQTIDYITNGDSKSMLNDVYDHVKDQPKYKKIKDAIAEYMSIDAGNEAFENIRMNMKVSTSVFRVDDIRWALEYNPKKASPFDLEAGKSIFLYPGDTDVTDIVLKIIAKQLEYHCRHRDYMGIRMKKKLRRIIVVLEECYSIGDTIDLAGWASVSRGFRTNLIIVYQSFSQIKEVYGEHRAESIMDDVGAVVILAVNSAQNASQYVDFAGEYIEEKKSVNKGGKSDGSYSKSFDNRPILTKNDFLRLRRNKEVIVLTDGNYYRISDTESARYYKIPSIKRISDRCLKAHRQINKD